MLDVYTSMAVTPSESWSVTMANTGISIGTMSMAVKPPLAPRKTPRTQIPISARFCGRVSRDPDRAGRWTALVHAAG
jgi:hypothetical protein